MTALALGLLTALVLAQGARAELRLTEFDVTFTDAAGRTVSQAGAHPFAMTTRLHLNGVPNGVGGEKMEEAVKDLLFEQMPGFVGNPTAVPRCATVDFLTGIGIGAGVDVPNCPDATAVGTTSVALVSPRVPGIINANGAVYNLEPPPGVAAKLGFWITGFPVALELGVEEAAPYRITGGPTNISQVAEVAGADFTLWGNPADDAHDHLRGHCLNPQDGSSLGKCEANVSTIPFLTMPRSCKGPLDTHYAADSWQIPGARLANGRPDLSDPAWDHGFAFTHDEAGNLQGMTGCGGLPFEPGIAARPTSAAATSPSGLEFSIATDNEGIANPDGISNADIEKAVVTLPPGFSANPALAGGLEICTEGQLAAETPFSVPGQGPTFTPRGAGCPEASKVGSVEVETPILAGEVLRGAAYIAEPYENPFGSLLALYVVIRDPKLGIVVKIPLKVAPDPATGQIVTIGEDLPPFPFSRFSMRLREGARSPLVTPPGCGEFEIDAKLYPSSGRAPFDAGSSFELVSGPNGSACPSGQAPFRPGFEAGTVNNLAGSYSPFHLRLSRVDGEQNLTRFASVLPPGVAGRIAGIQQCPEAGFERAKSRTGAHGGKEELSDPSCPEAAKIGRTLAGAGVGSQLAYVPGSLYLAGPYNGAPLSVIAITPAVVGPFDAGAVVVRQALTLNPVSGEVEVDGRASDPIPHILQGIPLNVRDLRVYADRPEFTLNATNCSEGQARATLFGGGTVLEPLPDTPVELNSRYQAADCASLPFKPKLAIDLLGGTKRGAFPALRATVTPPPGQANFSQAAVTLPRSAFLEQGHIRTICTRVQFAAGAGHGSQCPPGSIYGKASAWSPLLDQPATGSVFLRSSSNKLPDLVVALRGPASAAVEIEIAARIDAVSGGIRSTFTGIPDLPVSRFVLEMQGGQKGLIVNSRNLCAKPGGNKAKGRLVGQNGRRFDTNPVVRAVKCAKKGRKAKRNAMR